MAKELIFLPIESHVINSLYSFSHQVIQFGKHYTFFEALDKLDKMKVADNFTSYISRQEAYIGQPTEEIAEDSHYGITTEDCYGKPVKYVRADDLKELLRTFEFEELSKRQRCAIAYINELDDNDAVALYFN